MTTISEVLSDFPFDLAHAVYLGEDFSKQFATQLCTLRNAGKSGSQNPVHDNETIVTLLEEYKNQKHMQGELFDIIVDADDNSSLVETLKHLLIDNSIALEKELSQILYNLAVGNKSASDEASDPSSDILKSIVHAVAQAVKNRYSFGIVEAANVSKENDNLSFTVSWKPVMVGDTDLEDGFVHVGISVYNTSPLLRHPEAPHRLLEYIASMKKPVCIVIGDSLGRFNISAFEKVNSLMPKATRVAIQRGEPFVQKLTEAKAAVAAKRGEDLDRITILRWDDIETETYKSLVEACVSFYKENDFFSERLERIGRAVLESRGRDPSDAEKLEKVILYVLNELPYFLFGVNGTSGNNDIHYSQLLYPTYYSQVTDSSVSQQIFGLFPSVHKDERFAPLLQQLYELGSGKLAAGGLNVLPMGM